MTANEALPADRATSAVHLPILGAGLRSKLSLVAQLGKLRIVSLLLLAAVGGAFIGADALPSLPALLLLLVGGTLAAGGSSAINQYIERDIDRKMRRTRRRPLPSGKVAKPRQVLWAGAGAVACSILLSLPFNPPLAACLAGGACIYVGVYTIWLKPRSSLNIVIGGAAGSFAVLSGGAAVGAALEPSVLTLALLVFVWTPAHFWALAMVARADYQDAGFPMLPAHIDLRSSARWVVVHVMATVVAAVLLAASPSLSLLYFVPVVIFSGILTRLSLQLLRNPSPKLAFRLFGASNIFLTVILGAIVLARLGRVLFA
jgi:protoheme IX farnesyltransferase